MSSAVDIDGISKRFRLYNEKFTSLKERMIHPRRVPYRDFWALKDICLDVKQGETVGLLGHNGSGKSTLLKCIAGILLPTQGEIRTVGRVAALLELGAGFHPDLSGRENVYLNASLLGLKRRDIEARFDDIVDFAELEEHIDQQVKYYSSGMYVRLGFAVAVNVDPDILLVDEVLAVGDELFQRKCLDRVRQFQREGRTIIFVTHGADLVRQICDRAAVLDEGAMVACGPPGEAVRSFREHLLQRRRYDEVERLGEGEVGEAVARAEGEVDDTRAGRSHRSSPRLDPLVKITSVTFSHPNSGERAWMLPGDPLAVTIGYEAESRVEDVVAVVSVYSPDGTMLFAARNDWLNLPIGPLLGAGQISFNFGSVPLLDGTYPVSIGLHSLDGGVIYEWREQQSNFEVMNPAQTVGTLLVEASCTWHQPTGADEDSLPPSPSPRSRGRGRSPVPER